MSMTKRKTQFRASYLMGIVIVVAVLVGVNVLGTVRFKRFDLTENRMFTVSPAMGRILRELPDVVKVTYYVSKDLPEEFRGIRRDTLDRFQELEHVARGNFKYRIVDVPADIFDDTKRESDPSLKRLADELESEQVQAVNLAVRRTGSAEQALIFSTITVTYLDKPKEYIHAYSDPVRLEYELAMRLVRLSQKAKPVVAFFDGKPTVTQRPSRSPSMAPRRGHEFTALVGLMGQFFDVREVALNEKSPIPEDAGCLIVAQPSNLNERQKYEINRYISGGGDAVFFVSEHTVETASGRMPFPVVPNSPNLNDLFETWGFAIGPDLVADLKTSIEITSMVPVARGLATRRQWMPMFLYLTGEELDQRSPLTTRLGGLYFRNATPIVLDAKTLERNGIEAQTLAETSEESWFLPVAGMPFLSPFMFKEPPKEDFDGPQKLAVLFRGTFPFKYAGRPVPEWPKPAAPGDVEPGEEEAPFSVTSPRVGVEPNPTDGDGEAEGTDEAAEPEDEAASSQEEVMPDEAVLDEVEVVGLGEGGEESPPEVAPSSEKPAIAPPLELKPATVLVVSTVELIKITEGDLRGNPALTEDRLAFFTNAVETLALGQDLVSIRAKTLTSRPFEKSSKAKMTAYTLINLLTVPVFVVVLGMLRYLARRRSRRVYRERGLS